MAKASRGTYTQKVGMYTLVPTQHAVDVMVLAFKLQGVKSPMEKILPETQKQVVDLLALPGNPELLSLRVDRDVHEGRAGQKSAYIVARALAFDKIS